jgi:reactive intermediate/imine deaminase
MEIKMNKELKIVSTEKAAKPLGHYSQALVHNEIVYVAAQLGITPNQPKKVGSIEEQTEQALKNVQEILSATNSNLNRVLKVTVYISDIALWERVNQVFIKFFGEHRPARAVIPVKELHNGFQVAIDVIAAI